MAMNWMNIYKAYKGKWVALKSDEKTVIVSGKSAQVVHKKATSRGFKQPILFFVPVKLIPRIG